MKAILSSRSVAAALLLPFCAVATLAQQYTTPSAGGSGGGAFTSTCGTNKIMVGVKVKAGMYVDSIQPMCAGFGSDGKWNTEPAAEGLVAGGAGGAEVKIICPRNHAISSIQGRAGGFVERLQFACNPLSSTDAGYLTNPLGWQSTVAGTGEGSSAFNFGPNNCQSWLPGKGFTGRYGAFLDQVAMICEKGTPTVVANLLVSTTPGTAVTSSPTLSSPADNATVNADNGVTFSWQANAASGGYYQFCLWKGTACDATSKIVNRTTTTSKAYTKADLAGWFDTPLKWAAKTCNVDSSGASTCSGLSTARNVTLTVSSNKLTWTTLMTDATLGFTAPAHMKDKTIKEVINSTKTGRSDGKKCNECHFAGASKKYRPVTTATIDPGTSIDRGNPQSSSETYWWTQTGSTGIVERFCNVVMPDGSRKPTDLCTAFRKWLTDGGLTQ